jgi:hypothetical protein
VQICGICAICVLAQRSVRHRSHAHTQGQRSSNHNKIRKMNYATQQRLGVLAFNQFSSFSKLKAIVNKPMSAMLLYVNAYVINKTCSGSSLVAVFG